MENNHNIDKKFSEASKALEEPITFPGFDKVWNKVEEKLEKKNTKKRIIPLWLPYGVAVSLIVGLGAFYFINNKDAEVHLKLIATKNNMPIDQIEKIECTVKSNVEKESKEAKPSKNEVIAYEDIETVKKQNDIVFKLRKDKYSTDEYFIEKNNPVENVEVYEEKDGDNVKGEKIQNIEEVTMVGLKPVKKIAQVSSSVTVVSPQLAMGYSRNQQSNFKESKPNISTLNALQGQAYGIVIKSVGQPGSSSQVVIRGVASFNGNSQALYVINGVPASREAFEKINPKQIKNIEVLKDASAIALYGNRASNGVVIIKTKRLSKSERKELKRIQKVQDSLNKVKQLQKVMSNEEYDALIENPFELTRNESVSTFSIDVDNASYSNIRRMINNNGQVDKNAVRIEEMINYFKYDYPQPDQKYPFSINTEYNKAPWNPKHKLLKIGLQGRKIPMDNLPASNIVFLIDVSGSMDSENKLPLLKSSFKVLLDQLRPQDKVGIVVYAGSAGMVLSPTSAKEKNIIMEALDKLQAGGSTAGGEGIELAYKLAEENFIQGGNNRVVLATDGDFNVGVSSAKDLEILIEEKRKTGIFLTCLGYGMGNYKDNKLEILADKGNGNYAYIDNLQEANKFLGKEFAGSIYTIAKDVKIQIEFNPKYVQSYRLIGYENRKLRNEDFVNDKIDAGELGSGHTVTALYEIIPANVNSEFVPKETEHKYTSTSVSSNFGDELATVKFRYKKPDGDNSIEFSQIIKNSNESFGKASPDFKFASSVAWFGLVLRSSKLITDKNVASIEALAKEGKNKDEEGYRSEFIRLVETYGSFIK